MNSIVDVFREKRSKLLVQYFFKHEYAKRHFLITSDLTQYEKIAVSLLEKIVTKQYLGENKDRTLLEYHVSLKKRNLSIMNPEGYVLPKEWATNPTFYDSIIEAELFSRSTYSIPFYNLMLPADMIVTYENYQRDGETALVPILPELSVNEFLSSILLKAVFSYESVLPNNISFDDYEKQYIYELIDELQRSNKSSLDLSLAVISFKILNNQTLKNDEIQILNNKIDEFISPDFRQGSKNAIKMRLLGLLCYDLNLIQPLINVKFTMPHLLKFLNLILEIPYQKPYSELDKKKLRDARKIASISIENNSIMPSKNTGQYMMPPHINIPSYLTYFFNLLCAVQRTYDLRPQR